jgi:hypothetical protein
MWREGAHGRVWTRLDVEIARAELARATGLDLTMMSVRSVIANTLARS